MNQTENIVNQYMQAYSDHDLEKIRQLLHPQYTSVSSDGQKHQGIEEGVKIATMYLNAFPDMKIDIKNTYSAGDVTVAEFVSHGTHKGKFMDIEPTNRQVSVPVCDIIECRDGKIYSERDYFDAALIMQQLGVRQGSQSQSL